MESCTPSLTPVETSPINELPTEITRQIFRIAQTANQDGIDSYRHRFRTALTVSHVSRSWNRVAVGQPELWSTVSIARSIGQGQGVEAMHHLLARSWPCAISFEVVFRRPSTDQNSNALQVSIAGPGDNLEFDFWTTVLRPGANAGKYDIFRRFELLYLWGACEEVGSVLKVFMRYDELCSQARRSNPLPLKYLKVMTSTLRRDEESGLLPGSSTVVQPFNVCKISSNLAHLRSRGMRFSSYPQWRMERIVLEDIDLDTNLIRGLVAETGVRNLSLRRVTIPTWIDINSAHPLELSLWRRDRDMDTRLEHIELTDLVKHPRCDRTLETHGETAFTLFYEDLFIASTLARLKTLKLANMCPLAWGSLLSVLRPATGQAGLVFEVAETLSFRNVQGEQAEGEMRLCIPTSFPRLRTFNSLPIGTAQL